MGKLIAPQSETATDFSGQQLYRRQSPTLLTTPAEIRIKIYESLLVHDDDVALTPGMLRWHSDTPMVKLVGDFLALSSTNRQLRDETEEIFLRTNRFRFWTFGMFPRLPERYVDLMRHVRLYKCIPVRVCSFLISREQSVFHLEVEIAAQGEQLRVDMERLPDLPLERATVSRLQHSARASVEILHQSLERGRGITMKDLQAVATQLNCDWSSLRRQ